MKKRFRKWTAVLLAVVMIVMMIPFGTISFSAAETATEFVGVTQSEAVSWVNSKIGTWVGSGQCVALVQAYASYLGLSISGGKGNACDYTGATNISGTTRINNYSGFIPQSGDICVWGSYAWLHSGWQTTEYGHIGIVVSADASNMVTVECNLDAPYEGGICKKVTQNRPTSYVTCFLRPNFSGGSGEVNFGEEFYALITLTGSSNCLTAEDDWNVDICRYAYSQTLIYSQKQWWKFFRYYDGSYFIRSVETGKYLECENGSWQNGTNIVVSDATWSDAQKWNIYACGNGYQLKAKCTDCVIEMNASEFYQGVNCVSGYRDGSSAEIFNLYIQDFDKVKIPSLGTKNNKGIVEFFWENGECTTNYNIKIWQGNQVELGDAPINIWNPKNNSYSAYLDVGTYTAYIEGYNVFGDYVKAPPITFYVTYARADLGTDFYAAITHKESWTLLTAEDDCNVDICRYAYSPTRMYSQKQWWKFFRQNDGSYIIKSAETGKCLECENGANQNGTNVIINDENSTDAQKWYIYQTADGCQLQAECTDCVIEMDSNEFFQCVNCVSGTRDNSNAEIFVIDTLGFDYMRKPKLEVEIDDNTSLFTWRHGECTTNYNIKIWKGDSVLPVEAPISLWNVKNNSFVMNLDKGSYTAYIEGYNPLGDYAQSNSITFTINKQLQEIGDTNLDGTINICDVTAIQRHISELEPFTEEQLALADTNGDGEVTINDATHLQKYLAEFDVVLGAKQS